MKTIFLLILILVNFHNIEKTKFFDAEYEVIDQSYKNESPFSRSYISGRFILVTNDLEFKLNYDKSTVVLKKVLDIEEKTSLKAVIIEIDGYKICFEGMLNTNLTEGEVISKGSIVFESFEGQKLNVRAWTDEADELNEIDPIIFL